MDSDMINNICDGNLEELKNFPKIKITEKLSKQLISIMEERLIDVQRIINSNLESSSDLRFISCYYFEKKENIEKCILYLTKKIK